MLDVLLANLYGRINLAGRHEDDYIQRWSYKLPLQVLSLRANTRCRKSNSRSDWLDTKRPMQKSDLDQSFGLTNVQFYELDNVRHEVLIWALQLKKDFIYLN